MKSRVRSPLTGTVLFAGLLVLGQATPAPRADAEAPPDAPRLRLLLVQPDLLPFSQADLEAAARLRVRLADSDDPSALTAAVGPAAEDGLVDVRLPDRQRLVDVQGLAANDAARTVALVLLDFAGQAPLPPGPSRAEAAPALAEAVATKSDPPRFRAALLPGISWATDAGVSFTPAVRVSYSRRTVHLMASASYFRAGATLTNADASAEFVLDAVPLRAGVSYPIFRRVELQAAALLRPYHLSGEVAERSEQRGWDLQYGASLGAAVALASWGRLTAVTFAHVDAFTTSVSHTYRDVMVLRMYPWSLQAGLGLVLPLGGQG